MLTQVEFVGSFGYCQSRSVCGMIVVELNPGLKRLIAVHSRHV